MQLGNHQISERLKTDITDSSGKQLGSISQNPEKRVLEISLTDVGDSREAASSLRTLADLLERNPCNADTTADAKASADASADTKETPEAKAAADESADTEETPDAEAAADEGADTEETPEAEAAPDESADTEETPEAEAAADEGADTEETPEAEAAADESADTDATPEVEAMPDESTDIRSSEDLSTWVANKQANEASPTPGRPIQEVRVESWLQVPEILRALHNNEGPLRITYPEIKNSAIAAEQTEISKFLIQNAGQNLAGMLAALEDNIANCHMVSSERVSQEVAQEYLQSFSGTISAESSPLLTVAEVVRLDDSFEPTKRGAPRSARQNIAAREQILATITNTMANTGEYHTCIIEVPSSHVEIAKMFIKKKWDGIAENDRPETQHTKVWVAVDFVSSASIEEIDFEKFLEGAREVPKPRQKKTQSSSSLRDMHLSSS